MKKIWKMIYGQQRATQKLLNYLLANPPVLAIGQQLDRIGEIHGLMRRKKWFWRRFWPFLGPETDQEYRKRLSDHLMGKNR